MTYRLMRIISAIISLKTMSESRNRKVDQDGRPDTMRIHIQHSQRIASYMAQQSVTGLTYDDEALVGALENV
jgi:hypothetical protein